jgi:hypothetical protein
VHRTISVVLHIYLSCTRFVANVNQKLWVVPLIYSSKFLEQRTEGGLLNLEFEHMIEELKNPFFIFPFFRLDKETSSTVTGGIPIINPRHATSSRSTTTVMPLLQDLLLQ